MKIVFLNGGLANQVFQYIFFRFGQIKNPGEDWFLDNSFFFVHKVHNGYELKTVFGLTPPFLSQNFDPDVWGYMMQLKVTQNKSIPQILMENGTDIKMLVDTNNYDEWNPFNGDIYGSSTGEFNPRVVKMEGNIYYHGYWLNAAWFRAIEKEMREELVFPDIDESHNIEYLKRIKDTASCSIHIRRGDYLKFGVSAPDKLYLGWIKEMMEHAPDMTLFVFSDDLEYCRSHQQEIGLDLPKETVFVEGNSGEKAFRDMQLMSSCKYMINANSAFCFLAALLNKDLVGMISPPNRRI